MKVSTKTQYGIRAVIELAQRYRNGPLQLRIIAERQGISFKYLEQLMSILKTSGLIKSIRGAKGGYVLARPPSQIKMDDVFHCLEGQVVTLECVENAGSCIRSADCVARGLWTEVEQAVDHVLDSMSLQDLVDKASVPGKQDYDI